MFNSIGPLAALIVGLFVLAGTVETTAAFPPEHGKLPQSLHQLMESSVLQVKKNRCKKYMVCDYWAPATSCSQPPCCKKWRTEKVCE